MARNVQTNLVLLEIAEGLKKFIQDPNLEASIKEAYALTESEKANVAAAQKTLDDAEKLLADIAKRESELGDINKRINEANAIEELNKQALAKITAENKALDAREKLLKQKEEAIKISFDESEIKKAELVKLEATLKAKNDELIEYESRLNRAAAISQEALKAI
jgi:hypothetical protein